MLNKLSAVIAPFLILQIFSVQAETIHAVPGGGNWNNPNTWVENRVPAATDDVEINGKVSLERNTTISGLVVTRGSTLERISSNGNKTLTVNGDVINNGGTIQNHNGHTEADRYYYFYLLILRVSGNVTNNGDWRNYQLDLTKPDNLTIYGSRGIEPSKTNISAQNLTIAQANFPSDVQFLNENVNLTVLDDEVTFGKFTGKNVAITGTGPLTLEFTGEGTVETNVANNNNNIRRIIFSGNNQNIRGAYNATGEIVFSGNDQIISGTFTAGTIRIAGNSRISITANTIINGDLVVEQGAILERTSSNGNKTLTVNGDITNNGGTIQNHNGHTETDRYYYFYLLILRVSGDVTNNGVWRNYQLDLTKPDNLTINGSRLIESSKINISAQNITTTTQAYFPNEVNFERENVNLNVPAHRATFGKFKGKNVTISGAGPLMLEFIGEGTVDADFADTNNIRRLIFSGNNQNIQGNFDATELIRFSGSNQTISGTFTAESIRITDSGKKSITADTTFNGDLIVDSGSTLEKGWFNGVRTLTVNGNITNNGTIQNSNGRTEPDRYSHFYRLIIRVSGDVTNNGVWRNYRLDLTKPDNLTINGSATIESSKINISAQNITTTTQTNFPGEVTFQSANVNLTVPGNRATFGKFTGENVTISGTGPLTLEFTGEGTVETNVANNNNNIRRLIFSGNNQNIQGNFDATELIRFSGNNQTISGTLTAASIRITDSGKKSITANTIINGDLVVEQGAILERTSSNGNKTLSVNGDITNNGGTIQNHNGHTETDRYYYFYLLILRVSGDVTNNGVWRNYRTYVTWLPIENAQNYEFRIREEGGDWNEPVIVVGTSYEISDYLRNAESQNVNYDWQVRAIVNEEPTDWSEIKKILRPGILQFSVYYLEIDENEDSITLTITRTNGSAGAVSVEYATSDETATAGSDYTSVTLGTLNWAHHETDSKTITVDLIDDRIWEGNVNERFIASLGDTTGGATLGARRTVVVTLIENELPPPPRNENEVSPSPTEN